MARHRFQAMVVAGVIALQFAVASDAIVAQAPAGSATVLTGVVVDALTRAPVPFAQVQVAIDSFLSPDDKHDVVTTESGTFELRGVRPGMYHAAAYRTGYVPSYYDGSGRASIKPVRGLRVSADTRRLHLEIQLVPGAVISGTVFDRFGDPAPGVGIGTHRVGAGDRSGGLYFSQQGGGGSTNARGQYRVYGLEPGEYVVSIGGGGSFHIGSTDAPTVTEAQVFYPDALDPDGAMPIVVTAGEERSGIDIRQRLVALGAVSGTVAAPPGVTDVIVEMTTRRGRFARVSGPDLEYPGNRFQVKAIPPGRYWVTATAAPPGRAPGSPRSFWAAELITVDGRDLEGIALTLQPTTSVEGRVVVDPSAQGQIDAGRTFVNLSALPDSPPIDTSGIGLGVSARPSADGRFVIASVAPGRYKVRVTSLNRNNMQDVVTVSVAERPLPGAELDVPEGAAVSNVTIVIR